MDAEKVAFLAGTELPDAALIKTLLVATGKQGIPAKLKEKGDAIAHTCTCKCTNHYADNGTCNLHQHLHLPIQLHCHNGHNHLSGWDEERPVLTPLMRADKVGNIVSTCYTLQVTCTLCSLTLCNNK